MRQIPGLKKFPYHIFGLILFFITHGYSEYVGLIPPGELLGFFLFLALITSLLFICFRRMLRSSLSAGLITTFIMTFFLFFGAFQDLLKNSVLHIFSRYIIITPSFLICLILLFFYLKRSRRDFQKLTVYLNSVFIFIVLFDLTMIAYEMLKPGNRSKEPVSLFSNIPAGTNKPDIYLILLDEYSGTDALRGYFHYDNKAFEDSLTQMGFFVVKSPRSNYPMTHLSMASMFNIDYIKWMGTRKSVKVEDYTIALKKIGDSEVMRFLLLNGYKLYNHSIFDLKEQPSRFETGFMPFKLKLITSKTFLARIKTDLIWHFNLKIAGKIDWIGNIFQTEVHDGNSRLMSLTKDVADQKTAAPKFVYTHLMMPHSPFLFDSLGNSVNVNFFRTDISHSALDNAYLQYLVYTNHIVLNFLADMQKKTNGNSVIMVLSDHGYRGIPDTTKNASTFDTFNAIYIPGNDHKFFYDSMTNVNQFRALFNNLFGQQLKLLRDSSCIIN